MRWVSFVILVTVASVGALVSSRAARAQTGVCAVDALQAIAPEGTTIVTAAVVDAAGREPAHCLVDGHVATPGNEVNFRLGLPDPWNGKFYFVGVGGLGGTIGRLSGGLTRRYATASTDTGHVASDATWGADRAKEIDYGHRGTHATAVSARALTAAYYGTAPEHAYFDGCSNGGRQALMEVQRYPADFDGIIAGDPATGTPMQVGRALVFQKLLASADAHLSIEKVEMLSAATVAACDLADGLSDGLVSSPERCAFNLETLRCAEGDAPDCLTAAQFEVVKQIYGGVRLPTGEIYAHGFPVGHEGGATGWRAWITGTLPPAREAGGPLLFRASVPAGFSIAEQNLRFLATEDDDPRLSWRTVSFDEDLPRLKTMTEILSPLDPDLRPFRALGGKLLLYHGLSDPAISAYGTKDYYTAVGNIVGGQALLESFARLYLVPGMHHCSGGPGPDEFDMLTTLERWVEQGEAPGAVLAAHRTDGVVDRTRPLCPYPQVARYAGSGSIDDAANFSCQVP